MTTLVDLKTDHSVLAAASLASWVASCVEQSDLVVTANSDPLDIPVPKGAARVRNVDPVLKAGIAREAARGETGRSGSKVGKALCRFAKKTVASDRANRGFNTSLRTAYCNNAFVYFRGTEFQFVSLSSDGTRLGGRETLCIALAVAPYGHAYWCPPRAQGL